MAYDMLKLIKHTTGFAILDLCQMLIDSIKAYIHKHTYKRLVDPKNVVVIESSVAGVELARRRMHSLPTGHEIILIECNSRFNDIFDIPRYSVLHGHEKLAFIPYNGLWKPSHEIEID